MTVLVDTTVWSLGLRRRRERLSPPEEGLLIELERLIISDQAVLTGPIRQEVLSGVRGEGTFLTLRERLSKFHSLGIHPDDYDQAARFFNVCRSRGISGTHTDMLICALAYRHDVPVFSTDGDFPHYARHLPIRLHRPLPLAN